MTRFARAKGSKSSNEKRPEDGTPWEVMKEQLLNAKKESEDAKHREEVEKQRIENYQSFLKDQKTQKRKATWCDFPEDTTHKKVTNNLSQNLIKSFENKHNDDFVKVNQTSFKTKNIENNQKSKLSSPDNNKFSSEEVSSPKKKNKGKKKSKQGNSNDKNVIQATIKVTEQESISKKAKKKKSKNSNPVEESGACNVVTKESAELIQKPTQNSDIVPNEGEDVSIINKKNKKKKNKKQKVNTENIAEDETVTEEAPNNNQNTQPKREKKFIDKNKSKPNRRKPIPDNSFKLIINGKDVDLVRYDGFPIMKKDAERLNELKQNMMRRGIPKSEVQRNLKLERRRAEKALARLKRDVCYNCRKGGHNLSDCPELKSKIPGAEAPDGICFKCGSTEHRQFECKVQRDKEFRFATCFICKESGHIARQCPDNPKGLYPNGGCCKLCGDVTHLRKDCPMVNEQKEATSIKLATLTSEENIEEVARKANPAPKPQTKKPKKITF